jgi:hypothetical protein
MKTEHLLLIGGACLLGYFLWKQSTGEAFDWFGGGGGGGGGLGDSNGIGPDTTPSFTGGGGYRGYTNSGTGGAPAAYEVTTVAPMTTKVQMTGGNLNTFQSVPGSTRAALITVGTPAQQIQQFNTAPKVVVINGKATKVM